MLESVRSIDRVCDVQWVRGADADPAASPDLLLEAPHGATLARHFDEVRGELQDDYDDGLRDFFFVNTDVGSAELAVAIARGVVAAQPQRTALVVCCELPRTFCDTNRRIERDAVGAASRPGEMTPGLPPWVRHPRDRALLLDRYFALTLAPHQIFATGIAIELDTVTGRLSWVNAGHPPAFVLGIGDAFEELGTTAIMLGAQEPGAFVPDQQETHIRPESRILAYTDGITEARDPDGTMLGIDRLRSLIRNADPDAEWPRQLRVFASNFAHGRFTDDVLAVSLEFRAEGAPS